MTNDTQALLERLREGYDRNDLHTSAIEAADTIEALSSALATAERERDAMAALSEREAAKDAEIARLTDVLRSIAETQWDSGAADARVAMIRSDARSALAKSECAACHGKGEVYFGGTVPDPDLRECADCDGTGMNLAASLPSSSHEGIAMSEEPRRVVLEIGDNLGCLGLIAIVIICSTIVRIFG